VKVVTVLGTRPEIIRLSLVIPTLDRIVDHRLVHTGQNSQANLSDVFFDELGVRAPDRYLGVDTSSLGRQLATLMEGFERVLDEERPDRVLILGDTNSGLIAFNCKRRGIPVFHMEAGNRSYDNRIPEETNRVVIDHCSTVLMPYTGRSAENLVREGIDRSRIFVTGNPITEVLDHFAGSVDASPALEEQGFAPRSYIVATMHRAENVDNPAVLAGLVEALDGVARCWDMPLLLSVHPRTAQRLRDLGGLPATIRAVPALPFFAFLKLQKEAALVLTDSGTVQEESCVLGIPNITIRDVTERPETLEVGSNLVATTEPRAIVRAAKFLRSLGPTPAWTPPPEYQVRNVSQTVVRLLLGALPVVVQ
jgi:UDP-N-acetylglucosamine 2-epimerase (non-hydrolysing)